MTTDPQIEPVTDEDTRVAMQSYFINMKHILIHDRRRVAERQAGRHSVGSTLRHTNVARLRELSHAVTQGPDAIRRECSMRVPAEPDRDADLVLSSAADEIERLRAEVAQSDADYQDAITLAQINLNHFRAAEAEVARLTAACAAKDEAIRQASTDLRTVGNDYPGSSCYEWCWKRADAADLALSKDAGKGWIDATGAVEAVVLANYVGSGYATVPAEWIDSPVLIVRVAK